MSTKFLLCEKYAPTKIEDLILPPSVKKQLKNFVSTGNIPNLMLSGLPGIGKTQSIKALCNELDAQLMLVNGSDDARKLDYIRNEVQAFASTPSLTGSGRKVVLIDEFDNTTEAVQLLLRGFIEKFQGICSFCFTCNYLNKVEDAIVSRTTPLEFNYSKDEKKYAIAEFYKRLAYILDTEKIKYSKETLIQLIVQNFGNWRHIINICQGYSGSTSEIDVGILGEVNKQEIQTLFNFLKSKQFDKVREWLASHISNDPQSLVRMLYNNLDVYVEKSTIPIFVILLAKYEHHIVLGTDPEIQLLAMLTEAMSSCQFK